MSITNIQLPVLRSLRIEGYQLLPGRDGKGLAHEFHPGITVIAGINSLGKTTLLNILLRLLLGARQPIKLEQRDVGTGAHEMVDGDADVLRTRVMDSARDAVAEAVFSFGKRTAQIKRSLYDLSIIELKIDGRKIEGDAAALQSSLVELSGTDDEFDFYFLVRSFTFFLEDKASLIWNERGQFEVFRILCLPPAQAKEYARLADEIQKRDSEYRNKRVPVRRLRRELEAQRPASVDVKELRRESELLKIRLTGLREQNAELSNYITKAANKRADLLERSERVSLELEVAGRELEHDLEEFFSRAFPDLPDAVKVILGQLTSEKRCVVCENPQPTFPGRYRELADRGCCPFCERKLSSAEKVVPRPKFEASRIDAAEAKVKKLKATLEAVLREIETREKDIAELHDKKRVLSMEIITVDNERVKILQQLPPSETELDAKWKSLREQELALDEIIDDVRAKSAELKKLLEDARKSLKALQDKLTERFQYYAGHFLAEKCQIEWTTSNRRIAQEDPLLEFPVLEVRMSSGASGDVVTLRHDSSEVSESQREFIDLAFRMALFDAVKGAKQNAMLVIETPEASLDTVFVEKASRLLRRFAVDDNNVVIASTNINGSDMIGSLLGLNTPGRKTVAKDIKPFLINLLEEAAPNAALRENGARYRDDLAKALALPKKPNR